MLIRKIRDFCSLFFRRYLLKKNNVSIHLRSKIDKISKFEGENIISSKALIINSYIGYGSYVAVNSQIVNTIVGKYSSIGPNVKFISGQHPTKKIVSTHPAFYSTRPNGGITFTKVQLFEEFRYVDSNNKVQIKIGNDVWIGDSVMIMEGVTIGNGAIVASGALIIKDVPSYTIVGGVPAKVIRQRFTNQQIEALEKIKWWNKDFNWIKSNAKSFMDIDDFISKFG